MIFSKLFKEKWQSKNAKVRLQALTELNVSEPSDKHILVGLIESDPSKDVRLSALEKVNQFSTWLDASNNNDDPGVKTIAQQKVENIVLGLDTLTLDNKEKFAFLEQQPNQQLLEKWLFQETNSNLQITLYELLNNPQLAVKLFNKSDNSKLQTYIVEHVDDIALLEKLAKKTELNEVTSAINDKIAALVEAKEKPIKLAKQAQLTLAKYLALKDIPIYQDMIVKKDGIIGQWNELKADFSLLSEEEVTSFNLKWQTIEAQLSKIFAIKAEDYKQQQIELKLAQEKLAQSKAFHDNVTQLNQKITTAIYENTEIDKAQVEHLIDQQLNALSTSILDDSAKAQLSALFKQEQTKLLQLDLIAESITSATHLISQLSQVAIPQSVEQYTDKLNFYKDWQKQWRKVNKDSCYLLPKSITDSYQELTTQWNEANSPFERALLLQFKNVKNKFADVKRLINSGKFNASFGVFKKAEKSYLQLTEQQQQHLAKDYLACQDKINDLSDWESYVATPKKQALLKEAQAIAETPLASPLEQADKVKSFRKLWNSFGHAQADLNDELNTAFNLACEQAFAPCRLFYSEQEKLREQHRSDREQLITQSKALAMRVTEQGDINWKQLDSDLNKLLQKWRNAGEVDKQQYHRLNKEFTLAIKPVKHSINEFHQTNAQKKRALIGEAESLLKLDDKEQASHAIKQLQKQWRDIGYSGPKEENKLWKAFRVFNDQIFAMRSQQQEITTESNKLKLNELSIQLTHLDAQAEGQNSLVQIKSFIEEIDLLKEQLTVLKPQSNDMLAQVAAITTKLNNQKSALVKHKKEATWHTLFAIINNAIENEVDYDADDQFIKLDTKWKKQLKAIPKTEADSDRRKEMTVALELIAGVKPPESDHALTMKVQVELMQQQLTNKQVVSLEGIFSEWLMLGKLTHEDLPLIARIRPLFLI